MAVVVAFFLCWAPFHAQRLVAIYGASTGAEHLQDIYLIVTYVSGVLYYLSTCINPLLYSIMSHKFREAFKVRTAAGTGSRQCPRTSELIHVQAVLFRRHSNRGFASHLSSSRTGRGNGSTGLCPGRTRGSGAARPTSLQTVQVVIW